MSRTTPAARSSIRASELKAAQAGYGQTGSQPIVLSKRRTRRSSASSRPRTSASRWASSSTITTFRRRPFNSPIYDSGQIEGKLHRRRNDDAGQRTQRRRAAGQREDRRKRNDRTDARQARPRAIAAAPRCSGSALVLLFMIVVYRLPGFLADVALAIYVLVMMAHSGCSHATLTLPGIAGFVLSIGMAVDANVLIFERIKEEFWNGKSMRAAVRVGFAARILGRLRQPFHDDRRRGRALHARHRNGEGLRVYAVLGNGRSRCSPPCSSRASSSMRWWTTTC